MSGHANRKKRSQTFHGLKPDARAELAAELRKLYEEGASLREVAARSSFPVSVGGARTLILEADGTMRPAGGNHRKGGRKMQS